MNRSALVLGLVFAGALAPRRALAQTWPDLAVPPSPVGGGEEDAALVVAIEDYAFLPDVPGAASNGKAWVAWLTKTRKVPPTRVRTLYDRDAKHWRILDEAKNVASLAAAGGTTWLVFVGHGAPAKDGSDGVLVGVAADPTAEGLYRESVTQGAVLAALGTGRQSRTVAVVDACFSGRLAGGDSLAEGLQPTIALVGRAAAATVLSAARADEFAGALPRTSRPAFSYLVLGALRGWGDADGDGAVTAVEAVGYAGDVLAAALAGGRRQTPEVQGTPLTDPLARSSREPSPDLVCLLHGVCDTPPPAAARKDEVSRRLEADFAELTVVTDPPGLAFTLDGRSPSGTGPQKIAPESEHVLAVDDPCYEPTTDRFASFRGDRLTRVLRPRPKQAALDVTVTDGKANALVADVFVDGAKVGTAPGVFTVVLCAKELEVRHPKLGTAREALALVERKSTPVRLVLRDGPAIDWVRIPGDAFMMGSEEGSDDERPVHRVTLSTFEMARTETTVAQYEACVNAERCSKPRFLHGDTAYHAAESRDLLNWEASGREAHPVNGVTWEQAHDFCEFAGGRLPTEAEWEYAARGRQGRRYAWGDELPRRGGERPGNVADENTKLRWKRKVGDGYDDGHSGTAPVQSFPAGSSPFGLHDMTGNVWEWVQDWHASDYYASSPAKDPPGPAGGPARVIRGGSFIDAGSSLRASDRGVYHPQKAGAYVGFRCARSIR